MKHLILIILSVLGLINAAAQTSSDSDVQAVAIVNGLFFDKTMEAGTLVPGGATIVLLKDSDGGMLLAVYPPEGYEMDSSIIVKAIPAERVKNADKLLRDYNDRKPTTVAVYQGIGVEVGEPFISFEYSDIDNNVWNNEILKNKIYVINIWQSECGPCRKEMPILSEWKERFPDVTFLSASRHIKEEILPIIQRHNFTWTHLQEASDLVALVGQEGFPLTIVVDKEGIVRYAKVGASEENQSQAIAVIEELTREQ